MKSITLKNDINMTWLLCYQSAKISRIQGNFGSLRIGQYPVVCVRVLATAHFQFVFFVVEIFRNLYVNSSQGFYQKCKLRYIFEKKEEMKTYIILANVFLYDKKTHTQCRFGFYTQNRINEFFLTLSRLAKYY